MQPHLILARATLVQVSPNFATVPPRTASNLPRASRGSIAGGEPRRPARGVLCQPPCLAVSPRTHRQHDARTSRRTANGLRRLRTTVLRARAPNGRRGKWPKAKYSCCDFLLLTYKSRCPSPTHRAPSHGARGAPVVCQRLRVANGLAIPHSRAEATLLKVLRTRSRVGCALDDHHVLCCVAKNDELR